MPRAELKMQKHIVDSYKLHGGYASKWNDEYAKGKPDLVCAMPGFGLHLIEVKHRPQLDPSRINAIKNPMDPRQVSEAHALMKAGAMVMGGLAIGGTPTVSSASLAFFSPTLEVWYLNDVNWVAWCPQSKFDVVKLLQNWRTNRG